MKPTETLVIRYESDHHRDLHRVLLDAGFAFEVSSDLLIGRRYVHPKKPVVVLVEDGDDVSWLECKVLFRDKILTDDDYSEAEWHWMTEGPDTPERTIETLRRELHILLNIRPHYMTTPQIAAAKA